MFWGRGGGLGANPSCTTNSIGPQQQVASEFTLQAPCLFLVGIILAF